MFTKESRVDLQRITYDRTYFNTELVKMMQAGAMTEDGGLLANLNGVHLRPAMARNLAVFAKFGVDPNTKRLPIHDEIYDRGGAPVIDDTLMSEEIKGAFLVRGAGVRGSGGGSNVNCNNRFGSYALRSALAYIDSAPAVKSVDWSPTNNEYKRLHELRTRQDKTGRLASHPRGCLCTTSGRHHQQHGRAERGRLSAGAQNGSHGLGALQL